MNNLPPCLDKLFDIKVNKSNTKARYQSPLLLTDLRWVDLDLGCSTGRWAVLQVRCCPSKVVEHPKSKSTQPRSARRWVTLYVCGYHQGDPDLRFQSRLLLPPSLPISGHILGGATFGLPMLPEPVGAVRAAVHGVAPRAVKLGALSQIVAVLAVLE